MPFRLSQVPKDNIVPIRIPSGTVGSDLGETTIPIRVTDQTMLSRLNFPVLMQWNSSEAHYHTIVSERQVNKTSSGSVSHVCGLQSIPATGKWYWEIYLFNATFSGNLGVCYQNFDADSPSDDRWYITNAGVAYDDKATSLGTFTSYANLDTIGFALDRNTQRMWVSKNGVWMNSGDPAGGHGEIFDNIDVEDLTILAGSAGFCRYTLNRISAECSYEAPHGFSYLGDGDLKKLALIDSNKKQYPINISHHQWYRANNLGSGTVRTSSTSNSGWTGRTVRTIIPSADLPSEGGTHVRIRWMKGFNQWVFTNCWIGEQAETGNTYDFKPGTKQRITNDYGELGIPCTILNEGQYSDWVEFTIDPTKNYVIAIDDLGTYFSRRGFSGRNIWYKTADEAHVDAVTGYTQDSNYYAIVYQVECATPAATIYTRVSEILAASDNDYLLLYDPDQPDNDKYVRMSGEGDVQHVIEGGLYLASDSSPTSSTLTTSQYGIVDGNLWTGNVGGTWGDDESYGIDLKSSLLVSSLKVYITHGGGAGEKDWYADANGTLSVYSSDDNATWSLVQTFVQPSTTEEATGQISVVLAFDTAETARYFKVVPTGGGDLANDIGSNYSCQELEAYISPVESMWNQDYSAAYNFDQDPYWLQQLDVTGNDNHGTDAGSMGASDLLHYAISYLDFEGTDDTVATSSNLGITSYPIVVVGRFYVDDLTTDQPIFSGSDASNYIGLELYISTSGEVCLIYGDGTGNTSADYKLYKSGTAISATTYYNFVLSITAYGTHTFYLNTIETVLSSSSGTGSSVDLSNASYNIGSSLINSTFLNGRIGELRFGSFTVTSDFVNVYHAGNEGTLLQWPTDKLVPYQQNWTIAGRSENLDEFPIQVKISPKNDLCNRTEIFNRIAPIKGGIGSVTPKYHFTADYTQDSKIWNRLLSDSYGTISNMTPTRDSKVGWYLAGGAIDSTTRNVDFGIQLSFKSISLWVRRVDIADTGVILDEYATSDKLLYLQTTAQGHYVAFWDGTTANASNLTIADATDWHHIVIVEGASNNSHWIYLDGVKSSSALTSNFAGVFRYIGRRDTLSNQNSVDIANVQVFEDEQLTAAQVRELYLNDRETFETNMIHDNTVFLLESNDIQGSQKFIDLSDSFHPITVSGDTKHVETLSSYAKFTNSCIYFDGSDYLETADSTDFDLGTGSYTIELWVWVSSTPANQTLISRYTTWATTVAFYLRIGSDAKIRYVAGNSAAVDITTTNTINTSQWNHVAVCCYAGLTTVYINGIADNTDNSNPDIGDSVGIRIGANSAGAEYLTGYIQGVQIIKGTALYTGDFYPPIHLASAPDFRKLDLRKGGLTINHSMYTGIDLWEPHDKKPTSQYNFEPDTWDGTTVYDVMGYNEDNATTTNYYPKQGGPCNIYLEGGDITSSTKMIDLGADIPYKTLTFWMRVPEWGKVTYICGGYHIFTLRYLWFVNTDGRIYGQSLTSDPSPQYIYDEEWHHIAITERPGNSDNHYIWVDGVPDFSDFTVDSTGGEIRYIGCLNTSSGQNVADIADFQIYQRLLTEGEIRQQAEAGMPNVYPGKRAFMQVKPNLTADAITLTCDHNPNNEDNSVYVGQVGSSASRNVWDSSFMCRYSMSELMGDRGVPDHTSNEEDLIYTDNVSDGHLYEHQFGRGINFSVGTMRLRSAAVNFNILAAGYTIEAFYDLDTRPAWCCFIALQPTSACPVLRQYSSNGYHSIGRWDDNLLGSSEVKLGVPSHAGIRYIPSSGSAGTVDLICDGVEDTVTNEVTLPDLSARGVYVGNNNDYGADVDGRMLEVRISKTYRSNEWMTATYESLSDDLIDYNIGLYTWVQFVPPPPPAYEKPTGMFMGFPIGGATELFPKFRGNNDLLFPKKNYHRMIRYLLWLAFIGRLQ